MAKKLHINDPGYTYDTETNSMTRVAVKYRVIRSRCDIILAKKSTLFNATEIGLLGTNPIDKDGNYTSDHYGVYAVFTN